MLKLSVIVPIRNESRFIEHTLAQLIAQDLPRDEFEILVVDGMSDDGTPTLVREFAEKHPQHKIKLLENPRRLSSAARNIGFDQAGGAYVLVVDGHVYLSTRSLLRRSVELATEHDADVLGRPQRLRPPGITKLQEAIASVRASKVGHSGESHIYSQSVGFVSPISVAVMYRRSRLQDWGLFDERFDAAEDLEFNYRLEKAGETCLISPELEVFYYPRENLRGLFKQMQRYGLGRAKFLRKHPERFTVETVVPPAFVIGGLALAVGGLVWPVLWALLALVMASYGALVIAANLALIKRTGWFGLISIPIALAIHTGLGTGFLRGAVARMRLTK